MTYSGGVSVDVGGGDSTDYPAPGTGAAGLSGDTSPQQLIANYLNTGNEYTSPTTVLQGGASTSPPLQGGTTQTQGGTPGTQTQSIQVNQAAPAVAAPTPLTQPTINPLTFNASAPKVGNPLQPFTPVQNPINTNPQALAAIPARQQPYPMPVGGSSNQATGVPSPQLAGASGSPTAAPVQDSGVPQGGGGSGWLPNNVDNLPMGASTSPVAGQSIAPSFAAGINSGNMPPLPTPQRLTPDQAAVAAQMGQYKLDQRPPGSLDDSDVHDQNPLRVAAKQKLTAQIEEIKDGLVPYQKALDAINGGPAPKASPFSGGFKHLVGEAIKYGFTPQYTENPRLGANRTEAVRQHLEQNIHQRTAQLIALQEQKNKIDADQLADEAALAKEKREQERMKPEDIERWHKELGGLRPDDPRKIQRVGLLQAVRAIPNSEEAKQLLLNDFDPKMEAKTDIELAQQAQNFKNSVLRNAMNTKLAEGREAMAAVKKLSANLGNDLKKLQIEGARLKNGNAPTAYRNANALAQLNIQRKQGAANRDALKVAQHASDHADAIAIQSAKLKQNPFGFKDASIDAEEKRLDQEGKELRAEAKRIRDNLADGKNIEDDEEPEAAPAPAPQPLPANAGKMFKEAQAAMNSKKATLAEVNAGLQKSGFPDFITLSKRLQ